MAKNEIVIDKEQIANLKSLFSDSFRDFVHTYFEDFEKKDKELTAALHTKDVHSVIKIAHTLKGTSLNVGAKGLADLCEQLELAGKSGDLTVVESGYDDLQRVYPTYKNEYIRLTTLN